MSPSTLGYALLGLLREQPSSGYDLRKTFSLTPLVTFSDSPGAIYPALRRLEEARLIRGTIEDGSGLRRRKIFRVTAAGIAELRKWLNQPVVRDDVARGGDELMLRFAFMDGAVGRVAAVRFLKSLERELSSYVSTLREYLAEHRKEMPLSGRLALESGIRGYETRVVWARDALATYKRAQRKRP
jgi:DNA-binding PadR family transcriptional regulator